MSDTEVPAPQETPPTIPKPQPANKGTVDVLMGDAEPKPGETANGNGATQNANNAIGDVDIERAGSIDPLATPPPKTPKRKRSVIDWDTESEDDYDANGLIDVLSLIQDLREPDPEAVPEEQPGDLDHVTCDLSRLNGESFNYWCNHPDQFLKRILPTSKESLHHFCLEVAGVQAAVGALNAFYQGKAVTLPKVVQVLTDNDHGTLATITLTPDHGPEWHWARYLLVLKGQLGAEDPTILSRGKIRPGHATWGVMWVLGQIVRKSNTEKEKTRIKKTLERSRRKATAMKRLTESSSGVAAKFAMRSAVSSLTLKSGALAASAVKGPSGRRPAKKKLKTPVKVDDEEEEDVNDAMFGLQGIGDDDMDPDNAAEDAPRSTYGMTDAEVIAEYINEVDKHDQKLKSRPEQVARLHRAARSRLEHMRMLRNDNKAQVAYQNNLVRLHAAHVRHVTDIKYANKHQKFVAKCRRALDARFRSYHKRARPLEEEVEVQAPASQNVLEKTAEEEREEVERRAAAAKRKQEDEEKPIDTIVDLPPVPRQEIIKDLFQKAKKNDAFAPTNLSEACAALKIGDMVSKYMPGMRFALHWWQVLGAYWMDCLTRSAIFEWISGGLVADQIGLGKTIQAGARILKAIEDFNDMHPSPEEATASQNGLEMTAEAETEEKTAEAEIEEYVANMDYRDDLVMAFAWGESYADVYREPKPNKKPPFERPGEKARPFLYVTTAALCHQSAKELASMSARLKVTYIGGDQRVAAGKYSVLNAFPRKGVDHPDVYDTSNADAIYHVHVVSYNTLSRLIGPQAYWDAVKNNLDAYLKERGIPKHGFSWHDHQNDPANLPEHSDPRWVQSLEGLYSVVFADECQDGLRNASSFWRSVRWLRPAQTILMSGYPAPRGMDDIGSYLRLLERPELAQEFAELEQEYIRLLKAKTPEKDIPSFKPGVTNPYTLPDEDPNARFRYLYKSWKTFITSSTSPTYEDRIQQGKAAQRVLETIVLRRDFDSTLPGYPSHTIGSSMPPKRHYTLERVFAPTEERTYFNQFARWKKRLFTTHKNSAGSNVPAMNSRANKAQQILDFLPDCGLLHLEREAEKRPKDSVYGEGDDRLLEKYNKDRESWFYEKSPAYLAYAEQPKSSPTGNGERLRWIFSTAASKADGEHLRFDDNGQPIDWWKISNVDLAQQVINRSPKMQSILSLITDWVIFRQEKIIFWFMTPVIQVIVQTVLDLLKFPLFSVYSSSTAQQRTDVQDKWNSSESNTKILLASAMVYGTGYNLQKDSRVGVMVDTPDTDNREQQIIGRQYRGGQTLEVHFYRLTVRGTYSVSRLAENLLASLALNSVFMDYSSARADVASSASVAAAPDELVSRVEENFLEGFVRRALVDDPVDIADWEYAFIFSDRGQEIVEDLRLQHGHDLNWWPETLPYTVAFAGIASSLQTERITRIAGFPPEWTEHVIKITGEEMEARKRYREERNNGNDPDDMYHDPKTPKKKKTSRDLDRTFDSMGTDSPAAAPTTGSSFAQSVLAHTAYIDVAPPKSSPQTLKERDDEDAAAMMKALQVNGKKKEESSGPRSDVSDFEDDFPNFNDFVKRCNKHPSYIPTLDDAIGLSVSDKTKLTSWVRANRDKNFKGLAAPKAKKQTRGKKAKKGGKK